MDQLASTFPEQGAKITYREAIESYDVLERHAVGLVYNELFSPCAGAYDLLVYCFRHFSRSGRALYLPFQIWDKGRVEGGGRRTTSWDLALDDRIAPPTRSVTWIRQDGRSGLDI